MDIQIINHLLVNALIKPIVMLAVLVLLFFMLRKRSAAMRHFVLLLGFAGLLIMPLLGGLALAAGVMPSTLLSNLSLGVSSYWQQWLPWLTHCIGRYGVWILAGYSAITLSLIYYRLIGWTLLARKTMSASPVMDARLNDQRDQLAELLDVRVPVTLRTAKWVDSAQVWGHWRPVILLPRSAHLWTQEQQLAVLVHELGHVARRDWLSSQCVALVCAFFWFLPPIWWLAARLYEQAEIACDDMIYRLVTTPASARLPAAYAQSLLDFSGAVCHGDTAKNDGALGIVGHPDIYWRICSVLDVQRSHTAVAVESGQYWFSCSAVLLLLLAAIQVWPIAVPASAAPQQWINIALPPTQSKPAEPIAAIDWQQLSRLRPVLASAPIAAGEIEELRVVARPVFDRAELTQSKWDENAAPQLPQIQVRGYLPIHLQVPEYPAAAMARGMEGRVVVEFTIDPQGNIQQPIIIARPATRLFDKAVLNALKKSRYQPQTLDGVPVSLRGVTEEFVFRLQDTPLRR